MDYVLVSTCYTDSGYIIPDESVALVGPFGIKEEAELYNHEFLHGEAQVWKMLSPREGYTYAERAAA